MRYARMVVMPACAITPSISQETAEGPTNEKAQKTYKEASEYSQPRMTDAALDVGRARELHVAEKTAK